MVNLRTLPCQSKILTLEELKNKVKELRADGKKIAWTNGGFNTLHWGHVLYLEAAKPTTEADILIVGVNSDESVKQNGKENKLVECEQARSQRIGALACVNYVILMNGKDAMNELEALKPDFYVKGGDYTIDTIHQGERKLVESYGGKIVLVPSGIDISTTRLFQDIKERQRQ